jgi:hypothetical protein
VQTLSNWRALSGFGIGLLLGLLPVESARAQWTRLEAPMNEQQKKENGL